MPRQLTGMADAPPHVPRDPEHPGLQVQSLLFHKDVFPRKSDAREWALAHGFRAPAAEEQANYWRLRQYDPDLNEPESFRTIEFRPGVLAVVARPESAVLAMAALRVSGAPAGSGKGGTYANVVEARAYSRRHAGWADAIEQAVMALEAHGVTVDPVALGAGHFGTVFSLRQYPDWVVKITGDPSDAAAWATVHQRSLHLPGLAKVANVFAIPRRHEPYQLYGIILEKLEHIPSDETYSILTVFDNDRAVLKGQNPSDPILWQSAVDTIRMGKKDELRGEDGQVFWARETPPKPALAGQLQGLVDAAAALWGLGIVIYDFRHDNALQNAQGRWKLVDLGVSEVPEIEVPELSKVKKLIDPTSEPAAILSGASLRKAGGLCPPTHGKIKTSGLSEEHFKESAATAGITRKSPNWEPIAEAAREVLLGHGVVLGKLLGSGQYACAYNLKGDTTRIVKITGDPADAAAWQKVLNAIARGKKKWPKGLCHVSCVEAIPLEPESETVKVGTKRVKTRADRRMFVMIQERVGDLTYEEHTWFNREDVRLAVLKAAAPSADAEDEWAVEDLLEEDISLSAVHALIDTIRWLGSVDVNWHDLHGGNVMALGAGAKRVFKIVDLGYSVGGSVAVPVLDWPDTE